MNLPGPHIHSPIWVLLVAALACTAPDQEAPSPGPVVVIGVDGASWNVIEELWSRGDLPNLQVLAESGVRSQLIPVADASPVIWTSMATGVLPDRHGITNFVVKTQTGDVPVSSSIRKVPALWNMASTAARRVAVLGWWASWPAEEVQGIVVSDRLLGGLEKVTFPSKLDERLQRALDEAATSPQSGGRIEAQDRALGTLARQLIEDRFDLLMLYQRNVDAESHQYWKFFRPGSFSAVDSTEIERLGHRIPDAYSAVDALIGDLIRTASDDTTFFIVSDHGFYPLKRPRRRISFDLDRVLEALGYARFSGDTHEPEQTRAIAWDSPPDMRIKMVRLTPTNGEPAGSVLPGAVDSTRQQLAEDLSRVTYSSGRPVFFVRQPRGAERDRGGDLTVVVQSEGATSEIAFEGRQIELEISIGQEISGSHSKGTEGIFLASGPIIDSDARVESVHSLDIAPTLLVAMGLPVAEDFDGVPRLELFTDAFLHHNPVQRVSTWGQMEQGLPTKSADDDALIDELKALGYLE